MGQESDPKRMSWASLGDLSSRRGDVVDDVEGLADAEILVTDEGHGRGSRGGGGAFERPKAKSGLEEAESSRWGRSVWEDVLAVCFGLFGSCGGGFCRRGKGGVGRRSESLSK